MASYVLHKYLLLNLFLIEVSEKEKGIEEEEKKKLEEYSYRALQTIITKKNCSWEENLSYLDSFSYSSSFDNFYKNEELFLR